MNICVVGGGNIGTVLLGRLGNQKDHTVTLLTSKPNAWSHIITVFDSEKSTEITGSVREITDDAQKVLSQADILFITLPSNILIQKLGFFSKFIKAGTKVGFIPGTGGMEFYCKELLLKGCVVFGLQRVPYIARVKEYGKSAYCLSTKEEMQAAAIPSAQTDTVCAQLEALLSIPCKRLANYLTVTLTPSNPILHTARLYGLFHTYKEGDCWEEPIGFYDQWNTLSSQVLLQCDRELQMVCRALDKMDLSGVVSLTTHYQAYGTQAMTDKIRSIKSFQGIKTPMLCSNGKWIPDFNSRYFEEDFPYGLCILKSFALLLQIETPEMDRILSWYAKIKRLEYFKDGRFAGKDLQALPLPQNHGILTEEDVYAFYR